MSLVNALRFSKLEGAMISDEEYWMHGRRRTFFQNNLRSLLTPELANTHNMEILYGGTGDPYLHCAIINKVKKEIPQILSKDTVLKGKDSPVYEASKEILKIAQEASKIRIDQKLRLFFGFGIDDFNRGFYKKNGKNYQINQECIRQKAFNLISWGNKDSSVESIFESRGLILGYDLQEGIQLFYLNLENQVLSFNSGDYDTIGEGIYGAGHVFANYMRRKTMSKRLVGFPTIEGMVTLIESALVASQTYKNVGGYFNLLYLNGNEKDQKTRIKHIYEERAKLTTEIVAAKIRGFINTSVCHELVDSLVFQDASVSEIDQLLFKKASRHEDLDLYLRGYKIDLPYEFMPQNQEINSKITIEEGNILQGSNQEKMEGGAA